MDIESSPRLWLLQAVLAGLVLGAAVTGIVSYVTAEESLVFSRGDQAFFGAVAGAIGGAIAGFALWTLVALLRTLVRLASGTR